MSLSVGSRVGEYDVVGHLGSGGMGDVYRARDTRLGREVALKVVRDLHAEDPARVSRLRREARLLASLSHPNIATIHDVIEAEGVLCLVLELVEGPTLTERLARGPMDLAEALRIGAQLAAGLEAAHDAGVVHRDIKPSNLKLRPDGRLTILDFGVGKSANALRGEAGAATLDATQQAGVLGTPGYLSPEQARGQDVDRRADAWAFGCVLFECLAGKPAFPGDTPSDRLAASLTDDPDWAALPATMPAGLLRVLEGCLEKEPSHRLRDLRDARLEIEAARSATTGGGRRLVLPPARKARRARIAQALVAGSLVAVAAAGAWFARGRMSPAPARAARFEVALPAGSALLAEPACLDISPDGRRVVAWATTWRTPGSRPGLALRSLDSPEWTCLQDVFVAAHAAFSPDAASLAIMAERSVWTMSSSGGAPRKLAPAPAPAGIAWGRGDDIYHAPTRASAIWRVPASGGTASAVTTLRAEAGELSHRWPRLSHDGRHLAYTVKSADLVTFDDAALRVMDLRTGDDHEILAGGTFGTLAPSGHLLFARRNRLHAVPLGDDLRPAGPRVEIGAVRMDGASGAASFALAGDGTLLSLDGVFSRDSQVEIVLRDGASRRLGMPGPWAEPCVSPDGRHVLFTLLGANDQIWLMDLADGRSRPLTRGGGNRHSPQWMPGGARIAYYLEAPGRTGFYATDADGSGEETLLFLDEAQAESHPSFAPAPDGKSFFLTRLGRDGELEIVRAPLDGSAPVAVLDRAGPESVPRVSPDGRWLAFTADPGVYVTALDGSGAPLLVSSGYGIDLQAAAWGQDGRELCFSSDDGMQVVEMPESTSATSLPPPRVFVPGERLAAGKWDALPDGSGVIVVREPEAGPPPLWLNVWTGFLGELERLAPHAR